MLDKFKQKQVMTISEFLHKDTEKKLNIHNKCIGKFKDILFISILNISYCTNVIASSDSGVTKINNAGFTILSYIRVLGYWICICMCAFEVIRALLNGDTKSISKIVSKYVVGFGTLYFLPWVFDLIKETLS